MDWPDFDGRCLFLAGYQMGTGKESGRFRLIQTALKILLAVILGAFVVSKADVRELYTLRERILYGWLAAAVILFVSLTLLKAFQYYLLMGRRVNYPQVLQIVIIQNAFSNFVATSAGIASYLTLFHVDHDVKMSRSAAAFVLAKVGDLVSIGLFLVIASVSVWGRIGSIHLVVEILIAGIGAAIAGFLLLVILRQKFVGWLRHILAWFKLERIGLVSRGLDSLQGMIQQKQSLVFRSISIAVLFSMIYMGVNMVWFYTSLRTFSLEPAVIPTVFANTLLQLVSYMPIQVFGGLGLTETSVLYFYSFFQMDQVKLATVLIGTRLLFYLENILVLLYLPLHSLLTARSARKTAG